MGTVAMEGCVSTATMFKVGGTCQGDVHMKAQTEVFAAESLQDECFLTFQWVFLT